MRAEGEERGQGRREVHSERLRRDAWIISATDQPTKTWHTGRSRRDRPAMPSSGRCDTSSVALSSFSSLIRTSIGPEKEASMVLGPARVDEP